jgi:hypothetical protein
MEAIDAIRKGTSLSLQVVPAGSVSRQLESEYTGFAPRAKVTQLPASNEVAVSAVFVPSTAQILRLPVDRFPGVSHLRQNVSGSCSVGGAAYTYGRLVPPRDSGLDAELWVYWLEGMRGSWDTRLG